MMGMVLFAALAVVSARSPNGLCAPKDNKDDCLGLAHLYWSTKVGVPTKWRMDGNTSVCDWEGVGCDNKTGRVVELSLQNGGMQGTVPPELGNMSALANLYLDANALSGTLSSNLAHAPLTFLTAAQNSLSGSIPAEIFGTALQVLKLTDNKLSGAIPPPRTKMAASLLELRLAKNSLSGSIPEQLSTLSALSYLDLGQNQLESLPGEICQLFVVGQLGADSCELADNPFKCPLPDCGRQCLATCS